MARKNVSIVAQLDAKQAVLAKNTAAAKDRAEYHREQITVAETEAAIGTKQEVAVVKAREILAEADVTL